jgi:hypothetical protein
MRKLVTTLVALGALAFAAPALAASPVVLTAGPVKVKDYKMTLVASEAGSKDSLLVLFSRGSGASTQTHTYSFADGVDLKVAPTLASATLKANLGQFGSVAMSFGGSGKATAISPAGCTGAKYLSKRGSLGGAFRLVADTGYFGTISQKRLAASLGKQQGSGQLNCGGTGGAGTGGAGGNGSGGGVPEPVGGGTSGSGAGGAGGMGGAPTGAGTGGATGGGTGGGIGAGGSAGGAGSGGTTRRTLRQGDTGDDVRYLQERLIEHGYSLEADGDFGPFTASIVRTFQRENALTPDGIVGPQTWAVLERQPAWA